MKRLKNILLAFILVFCVGTNMFMFGSNNALNIVKAKANKIINYSYDSLGRLNKVEYVDGTIVDYTYDKNGNIKSVKVTHPQITTEKKTEDSTKTELTTENKQDTEKNTEETDRTEKTSELKEVTDNKTEETTDADKEKPTEEKTDTDYGTEGSTEKLTEEQPSGNNNTEESTEVKKTSEIKSDIDNKTEDKAEENTEKSTGITDDKTEEKMGDDENIENKGIAVKNEERNNNYLTEAKVNDGNTGKDENIEKEIILPTSPVYAVDESGVLSAFRRSRPVIKSLKKSYKKGNIYLTIKIAKLKKITDIEKIGFQIRYSKKKNFKGYKMISTNQSDKKKYVSKKFKVAKNKIYYVKVRAFVKTKTGKKIYSKFSKTKKIKINNK